jgi:hypothetical protein
MHDPHKYCQSLQEQDINKEMNKSNLIDQQSSLISKLNELFEQ